MKLSAVQCLLSLSQEQVYLLHLVRSFTLLYIGAILHTGLGIPTFRDAQGMWNILNPMDLATPEALAENPSRVWQFYEHRRKGALAASPNAGHDVLAKLSIPSYLDKVAPRAKNFHLITQNVDGLSSKALKRALDSMGENESKKYAKLKDTVIEIHGRLFDVKCTDKECGFIQQDSSYPLTPALGAAAVESFQELETKMRDIPVEDLPRCSKCGKLARPGVVMFGEMTEQADKINSVIFKADFIMVIGTSSTVRASS